MIVVDTTVWIEFFNRAQTPEDRYLQYLIRESHSLALTDLIFCEILQGIRDDAVYAQTRTIFLSYPILRMDSLVIFEQSASIYRACRWRGLTVRKTVDCLIAAVCIANDVELFHRDRDFT
ncbi:MAG: ribonuclease VapC [Nitrospirales bacterium]|nr:MAG: ribonuclease VapC [Nitrospirales bacterium]